MISLFDGVWEKPHDENFIKGANLEQTKEELKAGGLTDAHVPIPFTVLAVRTGGRLVLIDSGTGGGQAGGPKAGLLAQSMAAAGLDAKEVKTIIVSISTAITSSASWPRDEHGDVPRGRDHRSGCRAEMVDAAGGVNSAATARPCSAHPGYASSWKNVRQVDGEAEVAPGIRAIPAHGHTQGHTAHLISSGGAQLIATADATNIQALFVKHPDWQAAFDHVPDLAVETRRKLFDRAIAEKAMVAGYHWGLPNVGTLAKDGNG